MLAAKERAALNEANRRLKNDADWYSGVTRLFSR